jgi:hypothetical protein
LALTCPVIASGGGRAQNAASAPPAQDNSRLFSAPPVQFAFLLNLDSHAKVCHQLLEGLEGVLNVCERGEQLPTAGRR